jgi:hypothetical protein
MSLISSQACFLADLWRLCEYIRTLGLLITLGEGYRTQEQQDWYLKNKLTKTKHSRHQDRLAQDYNIFKVDAGNFTLLDDPVIWKKIGDYWKSLDPKNFWGGDIKGLVDLNHFERKP